MKDTEESEFSLIFSCRSQPLDCTYCSMSSMILFLNALSSDGVSESAFPMTGITLTWEDSRRMSSMSISRSE